MRAILTLLVIALCVVSTPGLTHVRLIEEPVARTDPVPATDTAPLRVVQGRDRDKEWEREQRRREREFEKREREREREERAYERARERENREREREREKWQRERERDRSDRAPDWGRNDSGPRDGTRVPPRSLNGVIKSQPRFRGAKITGVYIRRPARTSAGFMYEVWVRPRGGGETIVYVDPDTRRILYEVPGRR